MALMNDLDLRIRNPSSLIAELKNDEGTRLFPYRDITGHTTIGHGRNLSQHGISKHEAEYLLHNDIADAIESALGIFDDFDDWPTNAQHVAIGMIINLGETGFKKFKHTIAYLNAHCWVSAADELLNSLAARKLPKRYGRYAKKLRDIVIEK